MPCFLNTSRCPPAQNPACFFFGNQSPSTTLLNHKIKKVRQSQNNSVNTQENMATRQVRREFTIVVVNKTHYHESILLNWTLQQKRRYQQWRLHAIFLSQLSWIVESKELFCLGCVFFLEGWCDADFTTQRGLPSQRLSHKFKVKYVFCNTYDTNAKYFQGENSVVNQSRKTGMLVAWLGSVAWQPHGSQISSHMVQHLMIIFIPQNSKYLSLKSLRDGINHLAAKAGHAGIKQTQSYMTTAIPWSRDNR